VTGAGPLRLGQDLTCSAVLAGGAVLLAHRDHKPSCEASGDGLWREDAITHVLASHGRGHLFAADSA